MSATLRLVISKGRESGWKAPFAQCSSFFRVPFFVYRKSLLWPCHVCLPSPENAILTAVVIKDVPGTVHNDMLFLASLPNWVAIQVRGQRLRERVIRMTEQYKWAGFFVGYFCRGHALCMMWHVGADGDMDPLSCRKLDQSWVRMCASMVHPCHTSRFIM